MQQRNKQTTQGLNTLKLAGAKKALIILALAFVLSALLFVNYLDQIRSKAITESAYKTSQGYAAIISQFRSMYSSEVVSIAQKLGIKFSHDYHLKEMSLPLPSTMSLLLNEKITQSGVTNVKLYSPYPFAWRKETGGLKDDFAQSAWQALSDNPNIPFSRVEKINEKLSIRYALADTLQAECVFCHNNYPDTPKNDWQTGELIGVLEINHPIALGKNTTSRYFTQLKIIFCSVLLILFIGFYLLLRKFSQKTAALVVINDQFKHAQTEHKSLQIALNEAIDHTKTQKQQIDLALKEAQDANNIKSVFLANISHQIRTPMNAILGYTQIMRNSPSIQGESLNSLSVIHKSGEHLLNLINDILDMSKLESGATKLNITNFDILEVCNSAIEMFALKASQKHLVLSFTTDINVDTLIVNGDQLKLRQVIINLIGNALKFTPKGRITLKLTIQEDSMFCFSVIDTGIGVHQQYQHSIFDSFYQGENTAHHDGAGLGLSIAKKYLKLMHSEIKLISTPQVGSQFFFDICLPIQKKTQQVLGHNSAPKNSVVQNQKSSNIVLVVEDNSVDQSSLYQILTYNGLQVLHSRSTFDALGLLKIESANLAITDLTNPLIKSTELLQKIKQHYPYLPVIATIDYSLKGNIKHYEHLGFDNVITKPFSQDYVVSIISKYFDLNTQQNSINMPATHPMDEPDKNAEFELPAEFSALIIEQCDLYLVNEVEVLIDRLIEKFPDNEEYFFQLHNFVNNYDLEGLTSFLKGDTDAR